MVMDVYDEVGKIWLDITVTFTVLSQQFLEGLWKTMKKSH